MKKILILMLFFLIIVATAWGYLSVQEINRINANQFTSDNDNKFMSIILTPIYRLSDGDYHDYISTNSPFFIGDFIYSSNLNYEGEDYFLSIQKHPFSDNLDVVTEFEVINDDSTLSYYNCPILIDDFDFDYDSDKFYLECRQFDEQLVENEDIIKQMYDRAYAELVEMGYLESE